MYTKRTGRVIHTRDLVFIEDKSSGWVDPALKPSRDDDLSDTSNATDSSDSEDDEQKTPIR